MRSGYSMVRSAVKQCPLPLLRLPKHLRKVADLMLPYSTGIEIECRSNSEGQRELHKCGLMSIDCDMYEQRLRLPSGIPGLIALYKSCEVLNKHYELNEKSGIHYHIDCSELSGKEFNMLTSLAKKEKGTILKALESWGYDGSYNSWTVAGSSASSSAVRFNSNYKTMEIRIGEMTFDYELMIKRIIHCQNIVRGLKSSLKSTHPQGESKVARMLRLYATAC